MKQYEIEITRKYTVFVDAETKDEAIEQAETNYAELTHGIADLMTADILSVDGTPYEAKEDYWLVSRWCDEDIANALECCDYAATPENIATVRANVEHHHFADVITSEIFEHIYTVIFGLRDELTCDVNEPAPEETITGFFIDPLYNIAEPRTIEKSLDAYYKLLRCDTIDIVSRSIGEEYYDIICDDEALLKSSPIPSAIDRKGQVALCNPIFIVNYDGGCDVCSLNPDDIKHLQSYLTAIVIHVDGEAYATTAITGLPY